MTANQQLDGNYKPVAGSVGLYDPVTASFVAPQAGTTFTGSDSTVFAATKATVSPHVPAIVQKANNASTGSVATLAKAFANNNIVGNTIVVVAGCGNGTAMTVADSLGNTYTQAVTKANSTTFEAAIFYAVGILGGANTVTVTNAGTAASMAMQIYEVNGLLGQVVAQPDQSTSGTGTSATPTLSALAASTPNSLTFLGIAVGTAAQATSVTAATNWTLDSTQNTTTPAGLYSFGALSQSLASTTAVIPTATVASSEPYAAVAVIFRPVALGVSGTVTIGGYNYTHITTAATALNVKTGPGVLHAIIINTPVASGTIEFDDAVSHTNPMGIITLPGTLLSDGPKPAIYDLAFSTGLNITTTGTMDITVAWK